MLAKYQLQFSQPRILAPLRNRSIATRLRCFFTGGRQNVEEAIKGFWKVETVRHVAGFLQCFREPFFAPGFCQEVDL